MTPPSTSRPIPPDPAQPALDQTQYGVSERCVSKVCFTASEEGHLHSYERTHPFPLPRDSCGDSRPPRARLPAPRRKCTCAVRAAAWTSHPCRRIRGCRLPRPACGWAPGLLCCPCCLARRGGINAREIEAKERYYRHNWMRLALSLLWPCPHTHTHTPTSPTHIRTHTHT